MKKAVKYQFLIPILAIRHQFLKVTINLMIPYHNLTIEASVFIDRKMVALSTFSKICQKSFSLVDIFQLRKYQVLAFINVPTTHKRQQGSFIFRIWRVLIVKWQSFQFSTRFEKTMSCLHLKEISPAIFSKTVVQN